MQFYLYLQVKNYNNISYQRGDIEQYSLQLLPQYIGKEHI